MRFNKTFLCLLAGLLPQIVLALESDRHQPITIKANHVLINEKKGTSEYTGDVLFTQGSIRIAGDKIIIYQPNGVLQSVLIYGSPASFEQRSDKHKNKVQARAEKMEYITKEQKVYLESNAMVWQGQNRMRGDKIEYDTSTSTLSANKDDDSNNRVHTTIDPGRQ